MGNKLPTLYIRVYIQYSKIKALKAELHKDYPEVDVSKPDKKPNNPSDKVEIRVTTRTQGEEHQRLIEETVKEYGEIIGQPKIIGKLPLRTRIKQILKNFGLHFGIAYGATSGTVLIHHLSLVNILTNEYHNVTLDINIILILVLSLLPAFAVISPEIYRKRKYG